MNRSRRIVLVVVLVVAILVGGATLWSLLDADGTGGDGSAVESLSDRTTAAMAILRLENQLLIPRIAGLGVGLALGLAGGGGLAYVRRGGRM